MSRIARLIGTTKLQARPYQLKIVQKVTDMFTGEYVNGAGERTAPAKSVMIESPTGSGKTPMGLLSCKILTDIIPDLYIGWVAMRRNLLTQAAKENIRHQIGLNNISFISMFDKNPKELIAAKQAGRPMVMVVDECQHDAATSMTHLHNIIEPDYVLGMSATPFRTDRVKLCFDRIVKDCGIHQLIADGYLSPYNHYTIPEWEVEELFNFYVAEPERWGKSIFFFHRLEDCFKLTGMLNQIGIASDVITGDSDKEAQLAAFENGSLQVLTNCMMLTEGFDCPDLQTVWCRDSGRGTTTQMAGRVFRIHPDHPVKNIVQSKKTRWPFLKTALPREQYVWQVDRWMSLTVNPHINEINNRVRHAIATTVVTMPKYLTDKKSKKKGRRLVGL